MTSISGGCRKKSTEQPYLQRPEKVPEKVLDLSARAVYNTEVKINNLIVGEALQIKKETL